MPILVNISKQCKVEIIAIDVPVSVLRTMAAYLEVRKAIQHKTCVIKPDVVENLNSGFFSMICSLKRKMRSRPASVQ